MDKHFPPEMKTLASAHKVKKAFLLDYGSSPHANRCRNCAGMGYLYMFLATEGPYEHCGSSISKVSKFYDGKWWLARGWHQDDEQSKTEGTIAFECPDCHGLGYMDQAKLL